MGTQVSGKGWGRRRKKIITLSREWSYEKLWTLDPDVDPGDYSTPTFIVMAWMLALIDRLEAYSFCRFYFYIFVRLRYESWPLISKDQQFYDAKCCSPPIPH